MDLVTLLVVLLLAAVVFGGYGHYRTVLGPYAAWSPFGLIALAIIVYLLLRATGHV